jgi:hypothetical protein
VLATVLGELQGDERLAVETPEKPEPRAARSSAAVAPRCAATSGGNQERIIAGRRE